MSFDFFKEVEGLHDLAWACCSAKDMIVSSPSDSLKAMRMNAEGIAKYLYLASHFHKIENMSLDEVLQDVTVQACLNPTMVDAFRFVQNTEQANEASTDLAVDTAEKLYELIGETGKSLERIARYPKFDKQWFVKCLEDDSFPPEEETTLENVPGSTSVAKDQFREYLDFQNRPAVIEEKCLSECSCFHGSDIELYETLEVPSRPSLRHTITMIQNHFGYYALRALREATEKGEEKDICFEGTISLYGKNEKTTSGLSEFLYALFHEIPEADGFKIVGAYMGPWFDDSLLETEIAENFNLAVGSLGAKEHLTYSYIISFDYGNEISHGRFENGEWVNFEKKMSTDILEKRPSEKDWVCWGSMLEVEFDFDKYPNILKALRELVNNHFTQEDFDSGVEIWEEDSMFSMTGGFAWYEDGPRGIQSFMDELNAILVPNKDVIHVSFGGDWYCCDEPFAVATGIWTDDGFRVVGAEI